MDRIFVVENEEACSDAVKLALDGKYEIIVKENVEDAMEFLASEGHTLQGALVDLHLTKGTDFFGEEILKKLQSLGIPRAVFTSADLRQQRDGSLSFNFTERYGVSDTILKREDGGVRLEDLRYSVRRLVAESFEGKRSSVLSEVEAIFLELLGDLEKRRDRLGLLKDELTHAAGSRSARSQTDAEISVVTRTQRSLNSAMQRLLQQVAAATSIEELSSLRREARQACGKVD